ERAASQRYNVHAIVSSVGPYRFSATALGAASAKRSTTSTGSASPQKSAHRSVSYELGLSIRRRLIKRPVEGTLNHTVSRWLLTYLPGNIFSLAVGTQTQAPRSHAQKRSKTD